MVMVRMCDECGAWPAEELELATGRVIIDGEDRGQVVDLCKLHYPENADGMCGARNCRHVVLHWPGRMATWVPDVRRGGVKERGGRQWTRVWPGSDLVRLEDGD